MNDSFNNWHRGHKLTLTRLRLIIDNMKDDAIDLWKLILEQSRTSNMSGLSLSLQRLERGYNKLKKKTELLTFIFVNTILTTHLSCKY